MSLGPCSCPAPAILAREPAGGCVRWGGWGRPGEAARGSGGRGCARACQRVPGIIYDVRPMSLSAGPLRLLRTGGGWRLDGQAGLPPGPPGPLPIHPAVLSGLSWGLSLPAESLRIVSLLSSLCHPLSFPVSVFLPFLVSASLRPQRLCPFLFWLPLHLSTLCISLAVPRGFHSPCICLSQPPALNVCLALSSFPISVSLPSPAPCSVAAYPSGPGPSPPHSPAFTHTWLRPQESGAWRCGGGTPSSPWPLSPRGRSWAAVLGRAVGRTRSP